MDDSERRLALAKIRSGIARHGYHVYVIGGVVVPRYACTIGLRERLGLELVFAGGYYFSMDEVREILGLAVAELSREGNSEAQRFDAGPFGDFELKLIDPSWSKLMLLAAFDYYGNEEVKAKQILPNSRFRTIDVPNMAEEWQESGPIWRCLQSNDSGRSPKLDRAVTNVRALRGERITEAARWEDDSWELFAGHGPDVLSEDVRVVPLSILMAFDPSLAEIASLEVGQARWRDAEATEWQAWNSRQEGFD